MLSQYISNYTVIQEGDYEGTTSAGDEFPTFELANEYALSWAIDDWKDESLKLSEDGIYVNGDGKITVIDISFELTNLIM